MKYVLLALVGLTAVYAQPPVNDPCRTCEIILNIAEHHFNNNITDKAQLQAQLQRECQNIGQFEGQQAGQDCANLVNTNIDKIYDDLSSGKGTSTTCYDIGQCTSLTTQTFPHFTGSFPPYTGTGTFPPRPTFASRVARKEKILARLLRLRGNRNTAIGKQ